MADEIQPWAKLQNGALPMNLQDNGNGSYSVGTSALGAGVDTIAVPLADVLNGKYLLKFVDNGDDSFLIGTDNG